MKEYLKAKCVELANFTAKIQENGERQLKMRQVMWLMIHTETLIENQWIFEGASTSEHSQCLKQIKDMWPNASFEDNMWPNAYGVDIVASSNDDIVSSSKDTIFSG